MLLHGLNWFAEFPFLRFAETGSLLKTFDLKTFLKCFLTISVNRFIYAFTLLAPRSVPVKIK